MRLRRPLGEKNNIRSIRLVTSNYHMPRSMAEFRANNREVTILAHPVYSERVRKTGGGAGAALF